MLCSNLAASSKAFVVEETFRQIGGQHLIVCADKEDAAYFYNDLESLLGERGMDYSKKQVLFYPTSYKRPYEPEKPDNTYILSRTEVLQRVSTSERKTLIVSYPEALSEKVFTRKLLAKNTFKLKVGEKVNLDFLTDLLYDYEFENVDFVVEPGQFAIRGGLVDVFSFANDYPYRIEFFGDEVDSIRSFNIADQLSIEQLKQIVLLPNMQERAFIEDREAILQYLPDTTTVWLTDMAFFATQVDKEYDRAVEAFEKMQEQDEEVKALKPGQLFSKSDELLASLTKHTTVEFGVSSKLIPTSPIDSRQPTNQRGKCSAFDVVNDMGDENCQLTTEQLTTINFHTKPQPIFSKNFNLLIDDIAAHKEEGYRVIVFSESSKQLSRIQAILNDINHNDESHRDFETETIAIHGGFIDEDLKICCYTDHQIFERYHRFHLRDNFSTKQAITLKDLYELKPGDYVTHIDHGIGRFDGLETIENNGKPQEAIRLIYNNGDLLYVSIHSLHRIAKYSSKDGTEPNLSTLGSGAWNRLKNKTKSKVKDIARELIKLYAERKRTPGFKFSPDNYLQNELEASFIYEDTPDQLKATNDVKRDMESENPMDRLVCGDVGFGKTEVAMRAAFKACCDSKQVAVLVPTTVLALQHYHTFIRMLDGLGIRTELLIGSVRAADKKKLKQRIASGETQLVIGTHALIEADVVFHRLGLVVIDEQHRFGVEQRAKLWDKGTPHVLVMTATPIPRTLAMTLYGDLDCSVIDELPPGRTPVRTYHRTEPRRPLVFSFLKQQIDAGRQVYFVYPLIHESEKLDLKDLEDGLEMVQNYFPRPQYQVSIMHGQLTPDEKAFEMERFKQGKTHIMVSTTVIEVGVDVPNATVMVIENAERFGLSQLHQLRGRVGRGSEQSYCILMTKDNLSGTSRERIRTMCSTTDGFQIAEADLQLRGPGDLQGLQQSGVLDLKLASIVDDEPLVQATRNLVRDILDADPTLDRYPELQRHLAKSRNKLLWSKIS